MVSKKYIPIAMLKECTFCTVKKSSLTITYDVFMKIIKYVKDL